MRAAAEPNKAIKDDLYRLTTSTNTSTPAESQSWTYDAIGRITSNSRIGSYTYPSVGQPRPHAPLTAGPHSFTNYDGNGNLLVGAGRTLTWDTDNRITQATVGSTTTSFTYDAFGERLKKTTGTNSTRYPLGDDYEIAPDGTVTKYISIDGLGVVAKRVGPLASIQTFWHHVDRLGSINAITDAAGAEVFRKKYRPYGETLAQSGSNTESRGWIDQRNDTETGLTYLHARYYDPTIGTFLSPDPIGVSGGMNLYGYGLGNPVMGADRSGLLIRICITAGDDGGEFAELCIDPGPAPEWVPPRDRPRGPTCGQEGNPCPPPDCGSFSGDPRCDPPPPPPTPTPPLPTCDDNPENCLSNVVPPEPQNPNGGGQTGGGSTGGIDHVNPGFDPDDLGVPADPADRLRRPAPQRFGRFQEVPLPTEAQRLRRALGWTALAFLFEAVGNALPCSVVRTGARSGAGVFALGGAGEFGAHALMLGRGLARGASHAPHPAGRAITVGAIGGYVAVSGYSGATGVELLFTDPPCR